MPSGRDGIPRDLAHTNTGSGKSHLGKHQGGGTFVCAKCSKRYFKGALTAFKVPLPLGSRVLESIHENLPRHLSAEKGA